MPGSTSKTTMKRKGKRKRAASAAATDTSTNTGSPDRQSKRKRRRMSDTSGAAVRNGFVADAAELLTGITQDAGDGPGSATIGPLESANGNSNCNDSAPSASYIAAGPGTTKRKRVENGQTEEPLPAKVPKLTEEARVWQYVCRRAVFVSPPDANRKQKGEHSGVPGRVSAGRVSEKVYPGKTTITDVIVNNHRVKVTLTRESRVVRDWIERQKDETRFGLDVEWQPNRRKGGRENKVSLLQISAENDCLLVQMLFLDVIPAALKQFLRDPKMEKAGVGIQNDTKKLHRDHGLAGGGEVELIPLAVAHYKDDGLKRVGLKLLAKRVLGFDMNKSKAVTMSNWAKAHLTRSQVSYGCMDAWVSRAIYCELLKPSPVPAAA